MVEKMNLTIFGVVALVVGLIILYVLNKYKVTSLSASPIIFIIVLGVLLFIILKMISRPDSLSIGQFIIFAAVGGGIVYLLAKGIIDVPVFSVSRGALGSSPLLTWAVIVAAIYIIGKKLHWVR